MIQALIIEDEAPAAGRLRHLLGELAPDVAVLDVLDSVASSLGWFATHAAPDLLLLDIQLADGLSFDIFREMRPDSYVIFTTAYDEYAIRAFELNSVDYLLKPIDKEGLEGALDKFRRRQSRENAPDVQALLEALGPDRRKKHKERFLIQVGPAIRSVESSQCAFFYSLEKETFLCSFEDRHYPLEDSLDRLEEMLDPGQFFRINRQYIVSYKAIDRIRVLSRSRITVELRPATREPLKVSSSRAHNFRSWLDR
ncbi:MAG: LytTR family DNA-binding domain-containing protein [Bacteroidales bacterium]